MIQNLPPRTVSPEPRTVPLDLPGSNLDPPHHRPRSAQCLSNYIECISNYRIHAPDRPGQWARIIWTALEYQLSNTEAHSYAGFSGVPAAEHARRNSLNRAP